MIRTLLVHALKLALSIVILGLLGWRFDFRAIGTNLSLIALGAVAISIATTVLQSFFLALRLILVVAVWKVRFRFFDSLRVTLESMFFSQTFVSFVGGDVLRIWRVRRLGLPLADATAIVVVDRLIGIVVNHACLLASLPWLLAMLPSGFPKFVLLTLAVAGSAGIGVLLLLGLLRGRLGIFRRLPERFRNASVVVLVLEASTVGRHFLASWRGFAGAFVCSILIALCNVVVFGFILSGMDVDVRLAIACSLLVPAILEIAMLPIAIAGWGIREGAAVMAFGALGLSPDRAIGASVAFGLIGVVVSIIGGILWLVDRREMSVVALESASSNTVIPDAFATKASEDISRRSS